MIQQTSLVSVALLEEIVHGSRSPKDASEARMCGVEKQKNEYKHY